MRSTCSRSCFRRSPWSTKMHVSRSPMARCTSTAATEESTPPDSPQIAAPSPTCARTRSTVSSMNAPAVHVGRTPHTEKRKFDRISSPRRVCATSGWNWTPQIGRFSARKAASGSEAVEATPTYPGAARRRGRRGSTTPSWTRPTSKPAKMPPPRSTRQLRSAILPPARMDLPSLQVRDELHAVADAQDGDARARAAPGPCSGHPRRTRDDGPPERITPAGSHSLIQAQVAPRRVDLAVDALLPDAPGDELRELGSEVEDQDAVVLVAHVSDVFLSADQVLEGLAPADQRDAVSVHHALGGTASAVVVRGHGEAVGSRRAHGEELAGLGTSSSAVPRQEVAGLADRADHVHRLHGARIARVRPLDRMVAAVVARTDQLAHAPVHDHERLPGALHVLHPGEQHAGVADDGPSRLQHEAQPAARTRGTTSRGEPVHVEGRPRVVRDAVPTADVQVLQASAGGSELADERQHALQRAQVRLGVHDLRADVDVHAARAQVRAASRPIGRARPPPDRGMPNLVAACPVAVYSWGVGDRTSGFTRIAKGARTSIPAATSSSRRSSPGALHVEAVDAELEGPSHLVRRLAHPGEDDVRRGDARAVWRGTARRRW